ncbi:hypothetical protein EQU24_03085 [Methylotuvimicrobium buryatense]|uniref:Uncharacterized protein n=1 Tax=Methylotuvimicrobium buryatense TaxID=95641 RepID=A0A4V1IJG7_METBY|nr:hypothetical protein EQU24_03085 [Methylotuvimicrobium buryatense]
MSAARQIFAPAKSAFMPSMAIRFRRQAYMDVFTASCQASHRTAVKPTTCRSYFVHIPSDLSASFKKASCLLIERSYTTKRR